MRILVAFASRHGATRGIAERIARTIERPGLEVELRQAADVDGVEGYDAFVIGSAAYMGGWLADAATFVRQHRDVLATRPTWLFSSGPVGREPIDAKGRDVVKASVPKEFAEFGRAIQPRDERVFFGAYDPDAEPAMMADRFMHGFMRLFPSVRQQLPAGDFRDWPAIEAWGESIAAELMAAETPIPV
jgi:menaquinone-dependent protoporphyrinogen oxidase